MMETMKKAYRVGRTLGRQYGVPSLTAAYQYWSAAHRAAADPAQERAKHRDCRFLGHEIKYLGDRELLVLIDEIFLGHTYRFECSTSSPVIFDCGANIGMSVLFFKLCYPDSKVTAFEPSIESFGLLQGNVTRNRLSDVTLHNCALVGDERTLNLFVSPDRPASLRASLYEERAAGTPRMISGKTLASFIDGHVDFLKMDIEGAEEEVFANLLESGKASLVDQMVIEYHHQIRDGQQGLSYFLALLERAGFRYQVSGNAHFTRDPGGWQDVTIRARRMC